MPPRLTNFFVFLIETGLHNFGQAGPEPLDSNDPPALASQSAGITDVSHGAQPLVLFNVDLGQHDSCFPLRFWLVRSSELFCIFIIFFLSQFSSFFEMESPSVTQARVQLCNLGSLQPWTPGLKISSCLSLPSIRDYRCMPLCLTKFFLLLVLETGVSLGCLGWP